MEKINAEQVKDAGEKGHSLLRKILVGATYVGSGIFFGLAAAGVDMSKLKPLAKGLVGLGVACLE